MAVALITAYFLHIKFYFMNMTAAFLMAKKEAVTPMVGNQYRVVFIKRPSGFINGSIYTVQGIGDGYVKLNGYKLTFLLSGINFYKLEN